jgi:hypothetical protein
MRAQHDLAEHGEVEREPNGDGTAGDSGRAGLEIGEGIGRDDGEERPSPVRAIMATWGHYNSGAVRAGRVDDGLPAALASRHGLGRACLAAYGDAVLPQITFAIGQTLVTLDRLLNPSGAEKSLSSRRHYQPKAE